MKKHIAGLDGLRGCAAIVIATFHLYLLCSPTGLPLQDVWLVKSIYRYGWFSVEFFFFVSGFLMFYGRDGGSSGKTHNTYIYDRLTRLYPAYFISLLVCLVLTFLSWIWNISIPLAQNNLVTFIMSAFFLHYLGLREAVHCFNFPAWYLCTLWLCYLAGYVVLYRKYSKAKVAVLSLLGVVFGLVCFRVYELWPQLYFPFLNLDTGRGFLCFFTGGLFCLAMHADARYPSKKRSFILCAVALCIVIAMLATTELYYTDVIKAESFFGETRKYLPMVFFPCLLYLLIHIKPLAAFLDLKPFRWLGKISYSVFLWHYPTILTLYLLNTRFDLHIPYERKLFLLAYYFFILAVGSLSRKFIEEPAAKWLREHKSSFFDKLGSLTDNSL